MTHFGKNTVHFSPLTGLYILVVQRDLLHLVLLLRHILHLDISHFSAILVRTKTKLNTTTKPFY